MTKVNRRIRSIQKKPRFLWFRRMVSFIRLLIVSSVVFSVIGVAGFYSLTTAQQFLNRPIADIVVDGEFTYSSKSSIASVAKKMIGSSFVGEDMDRIKQQLEATPWIDSVHLYRQWPDRLLLTVTEQVPIARWGEQGFVNVRGELITTETHHALDHLGLLFSEQEDAAVMMQQYSTFTKLLQPYDLSIKTLTKDTRGAWEMRLNNDWLIKLGQGDIGRKLQQFSLLLDKKLLTTSMNIIVIDSRYNNGVAIEWGAANNIYREITADNVLNRMQKISPQLLPVSDNNIKQDHGMYKRG